MGAPIKNITIVGGGSSGWTAACHLAAVFQLPIQRGELKLTLIESPNIGIIGVGESTARTLPDVLRQIGINETDFIKRTDATFKLSGYFANWDKNPDGSPVTWVNPFFSQTDFGGFNPGHVFAKFGMHEDGEMIEEDYTGAMSVCPALIEAFKGPKHIGSKDYEAPIPYAYHTNAVEFAKMLMERGKELGVRHVLDDVVEVKIDDRGFVEALELKENGRHEIEFVIDATGFRGVILGQAMGEPFEPYDKYLYNDRAAVVQIPHADPTKIEPTSRATALGAGWSFRVPLYNRVGTGYIFSSKFLSDEEAIEEFKAFAGPLTHDKEMRVIRMRIGKTRRSWVNNCLAVGLSSGFVEPLEATAIYSVDVAMRWLQKYFPDSEFSPALQNRYNHLIDGLYSEIIDFIVLHFHLSNREDTPYWRTMRHELEIPDSLRENLELWRHAMPEETDFRTNTFFSAGSYLSALMGKRFYKGRSFPQVGSVVPDDYHRYLGMRRERTQKFLRELPDHYELLRSIRGEAPPQYTPLQANWGGYGFSIHKV